MNKPLILVVEDDTPVRNLITMTLKTHEYRYLSAQNGASAVMEALSHNPDIVLLDLGLPDMDGMEVLKSVRKWSNLPVVVVSARNHEHDKVEALDYGADDYLVKPFAFAELLARVRTLLRRGNTMITESQLKVADLSVDLVSRKVSRAGNRIVLTSKEFSLLEFFIRHQGEVLPRSLIASQVWDMNFDSDTNAIDVAVKRLRAKIDNDYGTKLIQTVRGVGYMLEIPDA